MKNKEIREKAKAANVRLWQIADVLYITDGNFSRKLRKEINGAEKEQILNIIDSLKEGEVNA